ncbi:hypothetical protein [Phenylobacterium soli]|uniref:hypothetical protein n=1 Tax=Phenylobacterium soli TaxID=2170551 RepID=UPI001401C42F|nr:hypothetical protein [Phenylobacterium soli]
MAGYAIPAIKSLPSFQQQLNALLGSVGDALNLLTAADITDELYVPLETEAGALLELDP